MICIPYGNGFVSIASIAFECPFCKKHYKDVDDKYHNRVVNNSSYITKVKCDCGNRFGLTYDYKGEFASFKLSKP